MNENGGSISFSFIWFIFIFVSFILPIVRQKRIEVRRIALIKALQRKRGTRVISLIHRQESISFLGIPLSRYINIEDSEQVLRAIRLTPPDMPIDLIVHTPGGLVLAAEQIAYGLSKHQAKVTVLVPHYAMSGGTLLALAADEIIMDENAVLGPVDPQIGSYPAASILSVLKRKPLDKIDDETLILADVAEKAIGQVKQTVKRIVSENLPAEQVEPVASLLTEGYFTHDYPITYKMIQGMGFSVSTHMPVEVYNLMELYPQPAQHRPSVSFVPVPYRGPKHTNGGKSD